MAIVFVKRTEVRGMVSQDLGSRGFQGVVVADDAARCAETLASNPLSLLVMDDEHEEKDLVSVLKAAQGRYRVDTRPIYLIAYEPQEKDFARALEYNVAQLHSGVFDVGSISQNIASMLDYGQRSELQLETYDRVLKARRAGESDQALLLLQKLYEEESDNVQVASELATALCDSNQWAKAKEMLVEVVARCTFDARSRHLLARCLMKEGRYDEASQFLQQASLLSPLNADRLCDIAEVMMNQSRVREALGSFHEALRLDPDCQVARNGQIQCQLLLGEANDALKIMRQLQDPSQFASVFNGAAVVAVRSGRFKQGVSLYQTALSQLVDHPDLSSRVHFNMGLGLYKWGKGELAILAFDRAVELDKTNEKARHNADQLALKFKRPGKSLESMAKIFSPAEGESEPWEEESITEMAG